MSAQDLRTRITAAHEASRPELRALAAELHADPELAFEEHRSRDRCARLLERHGFEVELGIGGLETAFRARCGTGSLVVALCAEYDALPGIGHACGHSLIAAASVGAGIALAAAAEDPESDLTVLVIGTPAEEHGAGKQILLDAGVFDGVHAALMVHPAPETGTYEMGESGSQAVGRWRATWTGRGAHAAANPADGVNANDAAVIAQVAAGLLRQRMRDGQRAALVPQQSGVTNIVPESATVDLECRARTMEEFGTLRDRLFDCLRAGAVATGCELSIEQTEPVYEPLRQDPILVGAWNEAIGGLGRPLAGPIPHSAASTDMGNVSRRVPSLHPFAGIPGALAALHTRDFADHAASEEGLRLMEDSAHAMALLLHAIAVDPARRAELLAAAARLHGEAAAR